MSTYTNQQQRPSSANLNNTTATMAVAQASANHLGDNSNRPASGAGSSANSRQFPFSGSENVFIPSTFGSADQAHLSNPIGGPPGQPVGYARGLPVMAAGMEPPNRPPPGLFPGESQANGMGGLNVSTTLSQHVTNAIRGGAEGKIIEYYCVPESNRDVGIVPTRHLKCSGVPGDSSPSGLKMFFEQFGDVSGLFIEKLLSNGLLYVSFFDLQASIQCHRDLQTKWPAIYCVRTTLDNVVNNFAAHPLTTEGEVQIEVLNGRCDTQTIVAALGTIGDLHTVQTHRNSEFTTVFAEFYDIRNALAAIQNLNGQKVEGLDIRVSWPPVDRIAWTKASQMIEIHEDQNVCVLHAGSTQLVNDARRLYGIPFGTNHRAAQDLAPNNYGPQSGTLVRGHPGALSIYDPESPPRYDLGMINRNILDLHNVRNGVDLRTTIMIRNIPNHLPQSVIKAWLDEVSYRKYDFLYLRIDFANHCNVGYCFVNYLHTRDIVQFVERRAGMRWSQFGSEKIIEVSYANIQGKAALIEKFRNSSVMDQPFEFRPRAFHSTGESFGLDMDFPPPNNLNRKLRSVTAAEHSGLYNPRHRNGNNYYSPARFGGVGHPRGRVFNNYAHRNFGNGNGYGSINGMARAPQINRLAITMPGFEPPLQVVAPYQNLSIQSGVPPAGVMAEIGRAGTLMQDANVFVAPQPVNGPASAFVHGIPAHISPPPSAASSGARVNSPGQFQTSMFPSPANTILRSASRMRQENVPPLPQSGIRSQGNQVRPQSALHGTGIPSPMTSIMARSPTPQVAMGTATGNTHLYGPHTPAAATRFGNGQSGASGFDVYDSPLSPAGLVNAGYVPTNPAPPEFSASTFADAYGESSMPDAQNGRIGSPAGYNAMDRHVDALRRIWDE